MAKRSWFGPLHIRSTEDMLLVSSVNRDISFEIPRQVLPQLCLLLKNTLEDEVENSLSWPGRQLMAENYSVSSEHAQELVKNLVETIKPGENKSASKWILHFLAENKDRPQLILAALSELKARDLSVDEFFMAYVYSNTDNIQANLHFTDYLRIVWAREPEDSDTISESEALGFISALKNNAILKGLNSDSQLWKLFAQNCKDWSRDDLLCLTLTVNELHSFQALLRLVALSGSTRPKALFHYLRCLTCSSASDWLAITLWEAKSIPASFADKLKLIEIFKSYLFGEDLQADCRLKATALADSLKLLPIKFDKERARFLLRACDISFEDLTPGLVDDLQRAFHFELNKQEISAILGENPGFCATDT